MASANLSGVKIGSLVDVHHVINEPLRAVIVDRAADWVCGAEKTYLRVGLADATGIKPALVYNRDMDDKMVLNTTIVITHFYFKTGHIIVTKGSKVYCCGDMSLPKAIQKRVKGSATAAVKPVISISAVKTSPIKATVSTTGTVVVDEATKMTKTDYGNCKLRTVTILDGNDRLRVTLWRDAVTADVKTGDEIIVKDATTYFNDHYKEVAVNVNYVDCLHVTDAIDKMMVCTIEGLDVRDDGAHALVLTPHGSSSMFIPDEVLRRDFGVAKSMDAKAMLPKQNVNVTYLKDVIINIAMN